MRKLPGRIVGETKDKEGRRGFVLTLQTRETAYPAREGHVQHLLEPGHSALSAAVYLAAMGPKGLAGAAKLSYNRRITCTSASRPSRGSKTCGPRSFFNEFAVRVPVEPSR